MTNRRIVLAITAATLIGCLCGALYGALTLPIDTGGKWTE